MSAPLTVVVRCKPSGEENAWKVDGNSLRYAENEVGSAPLAFDHVFSEASSHADLYDTAIAPIISSALQGENVSVLSYGLPNTGKSHTVFGTAGQTRIRAEARGVITRCAQQLFSALQDGLGDKGAVTRVTATFCQVFQDGRVADLFDTRKRNVEVAGPSAATSLYSLPGLTEETVTCQQDALRLVEKGYLMRNATGCVREAARKITLGASSSKPLQQYRPHCSHALFTYNLEHWEGRSAEMVVVSHVTVVDLAGRGILELLSSFPCSDPGLNVLQQILTVLPREGMSSTTPLFPQATLTKLLQGSLGGNSHTVLITAVSLGESTVIDTRQCLELAESARKIRNFCKPTTVPLTQSALGRSLEKARSLRSSLAGRLQVSLPVDTWEVVSAGVARVNGTKYDQLTSSTQNLLRKLSSVEGNLLYDGKPGKKSNDQSPSRSAAARSGPSSMVRPTAREQGGFAPPAKPVFKLPATVPTKRDVPCLKGEKGAEGGTEARGGEDVREGECEQEKEEPSSSSLDEESNSESDSEPTTPAVSSVPPPPPLRGIPHVKPDSPTVGAPIPQPHPLQVKPAPPTRLASIVASKGPDRTLFLPSSAPRQPPNWAPEIAGELSQMMPHVTKYSPQHSFEKTRLPAQATAIFLHSTHTPPPPPQPQPVLTSTPQAKRFLFPDPSVPASPVPSATGSEGTKMAGPPPPVEQELDDRAIRNSRPELHQPMNAPLPSPGRPALPSSSPLHPPTPKLPPTLPPRAQLSPISHVGLAPLTLSRPPLPPVQTTKAPSTSSMDETSSSESVTSEDDSDEARDDFDPNMRQRRLPMLSVRPLMSNPLRSIAQVPILPPISTPSQATPQYPFTQPPTYEHAGAHNRCQSSPQRSSSSPPGYYQLPGRVLGDGGGEGRQEEEEQEEGKEKDVDYTSSEEIHVAAMEGIKTSTLRKLVTEFGVDYTDHGGRTPLMYAVLGNQPKMCEALLTLGAAVNAKDSSGLTPLLWATYQARAQVIRTLLRHGADVGACDEDGRSAFHWAVKTPNIQCLKTLCKYTRSAVVNAPDSEGLSPLHWAVMSDQPHHVRMLLTSSNADVSTQDKEGRTALNYAVLNFSPSCIKAILDCCGSSVNATDPKGRTALHYACAEGSADCVRTLLTYRACDLHCSDARGTTPLHWAAAANQPGLIQLLLRRGADRGQRDDGEMTPLDHAQQRGHSECVRILQTYGLRRPLSAISVASQFAVPATPPPSLDEFGHVALRRPKRAFSLSGSSVSSFDRLPADGQALSECSHDEQPATDQSEALGLVTRNHDSAPVNTEERRGSATSVSQRRESPGSHDYQQNRQGVSRSRRVWSVISCGMCSERSNAIVPVQ